MPEHAASLLPKSLRFAAASCVAAVLATLPAAAAEPVFPAREWQVADPAAAGWSAAKLKLAEAFAREIGSTAVLIVADGRAIASWGDVARRVRVNSVRKSVLSALYGIAVAEGRIDLARTLRDLGIDDKPPSLTDAEKAATVRDLLMARSGVYHEAAAEPQSMKEKRPERGSHARGTFWYYNNWDFNALGSIYRKQAGEDIFAAVERRIARPIGMQDFTAADGKYVLARVSVHPAYHMDFSARDLARFGWLYLNGGRWEGRQVVPASWVTESTQPLSDAGPGIGYGYMWWPSKTDMHRNVKIGPGTYSARGFGGQFLMVAPSRGLVVAHLAAEALPEKGVERLLKLIMAAAPKPARR